MRTKKLLFSLLFLMLGTTTVLADKYYMPGSYKGGSNPRYTNLADMVGQKVMIYNAGLKGGVDYTGFLYVDGEGVEFDKCKERDLYVHNECYVYLVEGFDTDADSNYDYYALKSLSTGTYVDFSGNLSTAVAPLYISAYSSCGSKFADKVEEYGYGVTLVDKITEGTAVFAVSDNGGNYWCGDATSFATDATAAPFAFYRAYEVTSGDYLQDLHIYSRSDVFSAQKIYGLTLSGSSISAFPAADASLEYLVDGEYSTSVTTTGSSSGQHYFQFTFNNAVNEIYIYLKRNANATDAPASIDIWAQPEGNVFTPVQYSIKTGLDGKNEFYSAAIKLTGIVNPVAIQIRNSVTGEPMSFSEVSVLPVRDEVTDAFTYFSNPVSLKNSEAQYTDEVAENNKNNPDVKLLSGVPLAGNKYRIYADAYTGGAYVNRDIRTNGSNGLVANESYLTAAAADLDYYYWYCEQVDGGLAFKNVKTGKYLTLNGTQDAVYTWTFNTVLTHRHGVPLKNGSGEYLTVHNDGSQFETEVKNVFDQTLTDTQIKGADTADDTTDDVTVAAGVCSDYVFLPVERTATEKKITFTANELVKRNSSFSWNGAEYTLPFSRIFVTDDANPVLTVNCPDIHAFDGFYVDGNKLAGYTEGNTEYTFNIDDANVADNAVVEIRYSFTTVEDYSTNGKFYYICNLQEQAAAQQARPQRASINVGTGPTSQNSTFSYYAAFDSKSTNMTLVGKSGIDAASLFYFTSVKRSENNDYDQVYINNVLTTAKCRAANGWTDGGALYYLQPNAVADDSDIYQGYSISRTKLTARNNPGDAWVASMGDDADVVAEGWSESAGAAWAFVEVDDATALTLINSYIEKFKTYSVNIINNYSGDDVNPAKVTAYVNAINAVSHETTTTAEAMEKLRTLYSLSTKARYDILKLPTVTAENETQVSPKWYYIRNVESNKFYANYAGGKDYMSLIDGTVEGAKKLSNLFYIANETGTAVNANAVDEHLLVHIHNFRALNDSVLLGENTNVGSATNVTRTDEDKQTTTVLSNLGITGADVWRIAFEVASDGTNLNAYGSCYLAAVQGENETLGDNFPEGFQIYFRADRTLAVRVGYTGNNDSHRFTHLDGAFSNIKIVLTYGGGNIKIDVTNDAGVTQSVELPCSFRNGIKDLYAALPMTGVTINNITVDKIDAMKWDQHTTAKRDWYVLPSSNVDFPGLAIVMDGADDNNLGWTNYRTEDNMVFMDAGNADYSSWQFEKVENFDAHTEELLDEFNIADCVIYDKDLAGFYRDITTRYARIKLLDGLSDADNTVRDESEITEEETLFNELYALLSSYTGPNPEELKAPKPGKLYTIHHVPELMPNDFKVSDRNVVKVGEDVNVDNDIDSRGVWYFDGTETDGFYELDGALRLTSLHTQSGIYEAGFTADSMKLSDTQESVALAIEKVGGSIVRLKVGGNYLVTGADTENDYIVANANALDTPNYIATTFSHSGTVQSVKTSGALYDNVFVSTTFAFSGADAIKAVGEDITSSILCPDKNATASPEFVFTLTYTGLPANATYNNVALDIHALNNSRKYQETSDGVARQWNVAVKNVSDEALGSLADIDIAAGVNPDGDRHKIWNVALTTPATADANGNLTINLVVTKGTTNGGCFFGLSSVELSNSDARHDQWYIEEIENPETKVCYTTTIEEGYSTLMLGFNSTIPVGVEAHTGKIDGIVTDKKYLSMTQVGGTVIPAMQPVVLRNSDEGVAREAKFFYTAEEASPIDDSYMRGSLYYTVVSTDAIEEEYGGASINIYMLQSGKTGPRMYWIYEEYDKDGDLVDENGNKDPDGGNNDAGKHVLCKANKAYIVIKSGEANNRSSFQFSFRSGVATGIDGVEDDYRHNTGDMVVEGIYDLQGRKLNEITEPGIYIVNGEKVVVK